MWPRFEVPERHENAPDGWEDPKLPNFNEIWTAARAVGYSVGLHGSMVNDVDLIAAPWTERAVMSIVFIHHMTNALDARIIGNVVQKPHGRIAAIMQIDGYYKPIDLSVMPTR